MKNILILVAVVAACSFGGMLDNYVADLSQSNVHWVGKKTTGSHEGDVKLISGSMNFEKSIPLSGQFVLDMNSITVTDITDAANNKSLVEHLKETDFFGVAQHPTAELTIKRLDAVKSNEPNAPNYTAIAALTIKGITNEIRFPATIQVEGAKVTAHADITIDRTKWNIVYKSKSLLGSTADKFIYDEVEFAVDVVLRKQ